MAKTKGMMVLDQPDGEVAWGTPPLYKFLSPYTPSNYKNKIYGSYPFDAVFYLVWEFIVEKVPNLSR